ncbi:hypothetical protein ACFPPD_04860 [Cohnella suwonensis]|uniref:Phosphodiester glycosidase domain-containing protein n=1 Tax=Cohnella suwonensis TaxID=696072 RepID=A0ABW0LRZ5_9BACL
MNISNETITIHRKYGRRIVVGVIALAAMLAVLLVFATRGGGNVPKDEELNMPKEYVYTRFVATNGMELHVLRTRPSNVTLQAIDNNVTISPFYGVNGGFFYQEALLSIAVVNDKPVNEAKGTYGAGSANVKYERGTLVWDGATDRLDVQQAGSAEALAVTDRSRYWAQGGISMSLDRDDLWLERIAAENAPYPFEDRLRSAAVYDTAGDLYLIVGTTKGTLADFREAIVEKVGDGKLENGVFLDGDGSSQLRSREIRLSGDGRPVVQMLALLR